MDECWCHISQNAINVDVTCCKILLNVVATCKALKQIVGVRYSVVAKYDDC